MMTWCSGAQLRRKRNCSVKLKRGDEMDISYNTIKKNKTLSEFVSTEEEEDEE